MNYLHCKDTSDLIHLTDEIDEMATAIASLAEDPAYAEKTRRISEKIKNFSSEMEVLLKEVNRVWYAVQKYDDNKWSKEDAINEIKKAVNS